MTCSRLVSINSSVCIKDGVTGKFNSNKDCATEEVEWGQTTLKSYVKQRSTIYSFILGRIAAYLSAFDNGTVDRSGFDHSREQFAFDNKG